MLPDSTPPILNLELAIRMNIQLRESGHYTQEMMRGILGRRIARLDLRHRIMETFLSASRQLASGKIDLSEAESIALNSVSSSRSALKQRAEDRNNEIRRLRSIKGVGPVLAERLLDEFGSATAVARAPIDRIQVVQGIKRKTAEIISRSAKTLFQ